jgi:hypothetical protein
MLGPIFWRAELTLPLLAELEDTRDFADANASLSVSDVDAMTAQGGVIAGTPVEADRSGVRRVGEVKKDMLASEEAATSVLTGVDGPELQVELFGMRDGSVISTLRYELVLKCAGRT